MINENAEASFFSHELFQALLDPSQPFDIVEAMRVFEQQRLSLLECMKQIDCYEDGDIPQMDQAFAVLRSSNIDRQSCLRVAKTYLTFSKMGLLAQEFKNPEGTIQSILQSLKTEKDGYPVLSEKENILRWILLNVLPEYPALFEGYAQDLYRYVLTTEHLLLFFGGIRTRIQEDEKLTSLEQGNVLLSLRKDAAEAIVRLKKHLPIVFALQKMGLEDIFLALPAIQDIASTFKQLRICSPLRLTVPAKLAPLIQYLFDDDERIEVYSIETQDMDLYLESLQRLAYPTIEKRNNWEDREFSTSGADQGGIVLSLGTRDLDPDKIQQVKQDKDIGFGTISFLNTSPYADPEGVSPSATNFRRAMQRSLSHILGIKVYTDRQRDTIDQLTSRLEQYLFSYTLMSSSWRDTFDTLATQHGFEQGYICIIERGTIESKQLTANLFLFILEEIADVCKKRNIGVLLIKNQNSERPGSEQFLDIARQKDIPYHEILIREDVAYILAFLKHARGVIGPDTFLTHAAEYFVGMPVIDMFSNSNCYAFRLNGRMQCVEHPLAKGTRWDSNLATYPESELYRREIVHPFTIISDEERSKYHPLIYAVQTIFAQRLREGLRLFRVQLLLQEKARTDSTEMVET